MESKTRVFGWQTWLFCKYNIGLKVFSGSHLSSWREFKLLSQYCFGYTYSQISLILINESILLGLGTGFQSNFRGWQLPFGTYHRGLKEVKWFLKG